MRFEKFDFFVVVLQRDCFANTENSLFERFWGPGSPDGEDAFEQSWGEGVLWMNPPFDLFDRVLDKILRDKAHTILLVPQWQKRKFYHRAQGLALDCLTFPVGAKLFERQGRPVGGIKWPVTIFLVCGHSPRCEKCEFHNGRGGTLNRRVPPIWSGGKRNLPF